MQLELLKLMVLLGGYSAQSHAAQTCGKHQRSSDYPRTKLPTDLLEVCLYVRSVVPWHGLLS